jgi:hypothetical protein
MLGCETKTRVLPMKKIATRLMTDAGELDRRIISVASTDHANEKSARAITEAIVTSGWTLSVGDSILIEVG